VTAALFSAPPAVLGPQLGLDLSIVSQFLAISTGTSDEPKELGQPKPSGLTETRLLASAGFACGAYPAWETLRPLVSPPPRQTASV
jgi:hypothetical protein